MYNTQGEFRCYQEILHRSRPVSLFYHPMSRMSRAAQFAPFDALTGYGAAIREMARKTEPRRELTEEEKAILNRQLLRLHPGSEIAVCYFLPDLRKDGGSYRCLTGIVCKLTPHSLLLSDSTDIPLENLYHLELCEPLFFSDGCANEDFSV